MMLVGLANRSAQIPFYILHLILHKYPLSVKQPTIVFIHI